MASLLKAREFVVFSNESHFFFSKVGVKAASFEMIWSQKPLKNPETFSTLFELIEILVMEFITLWSGIDAPIGDHI